MNNDDVVLWWEERKVEEDVATVFENHKKVAFNIASEASYVYILKGHKLIKNAKNSQKFNCDILVFFKQCEHSA